MSRVSRGVGAYLRGEGTLDRLIPRGGEATLPVGFVAAVMAFFALLALALGLAAGRLAETWGVELAGTATLQIVAPDSEVETQARAALNVLRTTPGVDEVRIITPAEQRALLEPWLGTDFAVDALPLPLLIEIQSVPGQLNTESLRLRLAAEAPGAVLDDHGAWRQPLVATAKRLRIFAFACIGAMVLALGAVLTLAARAGVAANAGVIRTLRLVGARDATITGALSRRFTLTATGGAAVGTGMGLLLLAFLPHASEQGFFLVGIGLSGAEWLWPLAIPPLAGLIAHFATRAAARRSLRRWS